MLGHKNKKGLSKYDSPFLLDTNRLQIWIIVLLHYYKNANYVGKLVAGVIPSQVNPTAETLVTVVV